MNDRHLMAILARAEGIPTGHYDAKDYWHLKCLMSRIAQAGAEMAVRDSIATGMTAAEAVDHHCPVNHRKAIAEARAALGMRS